MKGRITSKGKLFIVRGSVEKLQECRYKQRYCGDWCPSFGEPKTNSILYNGSTIVLEICDNKILLFN